MRPLLAALLLLLPLPCLAKDDGGQGQHDDRFPARVKLRSGEEPMVGEARIRKGKIELRADGRSHKLDPAEVDWVEELSPYAPPTALQVNRAKIDYVKKLELMQQVESPPASSWVRLGIWCRESGLEARAEEAFLKALELDTEHRDARRELGFFKDGDDWKKATEVAAERFAALSKDDTKALLSYGDWASDFLIPQGREALDLVLQKDFRDPKALRAMRRYTERYEHTTKLTFPLRGRWFASLDPTRHHQKKAYAVYALDLMKLNSSGDKHSGKGRELSDYFTWDEPVYAVADGVVVDARDGYPDLAVGAPPRPEKHNGLAIRHENAEHSFYVHLKKDSLTVKLGDTVKAGQVIARVGNSGGTAVPHLHFTLAIPSALSVPWVCEEYFVLVGDALVRFKRGRPREGQIIEMPESGSRAD